MSHVQSATHGLFPTSLPKLRRVHVEATGPPQPHRLATGQLASDGPAAGVCRGPACMHVCVCVHVCLRVYAYAPETGVAFSSFD